MRKKKKFSLYPIVWDSEHRKSDYPLKLPSTCIVGEEIHYVHRISIFQVCRIYQSVFMIDTASGSNRDISAVQLLFSDRLLLVNLLNSSLMFFIFWSPDHPFVTTVQINMDLFQFLMVPIISIQSTQSLNHHSVIIQSSMLFLINNHRISSDSFIV